MKIDENTNIPDDTVEQGDRQNRREFFNSLGKWSMIVVAAASFLRGSVTQVNASREGARPEWATPENVFQRLAKRKHKQHVDSPGGHINFPHADVPHVDQNIQQRGGTVAPSPSGRPSKVTE